MSQNHYDECMCDDHDYGVEGFARKELSKARNRRLSESEKTRFIEQFRAWGISHSLLKEFTEAYRIGPDGKPLYET